MLRAGQQEQKKEA
jgi:hypothetical protein